MFKVFNKNLIATILIGIILSSCNSKKENFDVDLSNFKIPKKSTVKTKNPENLESSEIKKETIENKLKNYKKNSEVLSLVKIGKKDPFSEGGQVNTFDQDLKLTGFLNTDINNYVFVSYLNNEGTITEGSIGGINTNLLPNGAKVINIDPKNMKLTINFENEDYFFELSNLLLTK